jgi:hypothetical protein
MILSFLLLLGPFIGAFLIWNSPEEVKPGHIWFLHLSRVLWLIGAVVIALTLPIWCLLIPPLLFIAIEFSKKYFLYAASAYLVAAYTALWQSILVSMLCSALYLAFMCERCVTPEKADMKKVWNHARIFLLPMILSLALSFVP